MPTTQSDLAELTLLGRNAAPGRKLETFPNHNPERRYTVTLTSEEFTCICPKTGLPDFAGDCHAVVGRQIKAAAINRNFNAQHAGGQGVERQPL